MAFQFLCPQGHLLQADASQMGRTINCPTCGVLFVVPTVSASPSVQTVTQVPPVMPPAAPESFAAEPEVDDPLNLNLRKRSSRRFALLDEVPVEEPSQQEAFPDVASGTQSAFDPVDSGPRLVHIDCPQGHELITPMDTMGQEVLCPHCGEQFHLRYEKTREYKAKHFWKEEARQQKLGQKWLMWAVIAGVLVLGMLAGMMIYSMN